MAVTISGTQLVHLAVNDPFNLDVYAWPRCGQLQRLTANQADAIEEGAQYYDALSGNDKAPGISAGDAFR
jgi:hypothetical protein